MLPFFWYSAFSLALARCSAALALVSASTASRSSAALASDESFLRGEILRSLPPSLGPSAVAAPEAVAWPLPWVSWPFPAWHPC